MNSVFIAQSTDGYIADKDGKIDWLNQIPNPNNIDMGYNSFINRIDAIIMGRKTLKTIIGFDVEWPYSKPVFVLSSKIKITPQELADKVEVLNDTPLKIIETLQKKGYNNNYIDGGVCIQNFLKEDLIDEMIITTIPILLGEGHRLFGNQTFQQNYKLISSQVFLNNISQVHFKRERKKT